MSLHFSKENILARPDSGYYSPEKITLLKRIFDNACKNAGIIEQRERDSLASKLLVAGKTFEDEAALIEFAKRSISSYRR